MYLENYSAEVPSIFVSVLPLHYLNIKLPILMSNHNEEYTPNKKRDWAIFVVSTVVMVGILFWKPEWIWVTFPFQFTALAGAMGRL